MKPSSSKSPGASIDAAPARCRHCSADERMPLRQALELMSSCNNCRVDIQIHGQWTNIGWRIYTGLCARYGEAPVAALWHGDSREQPPALPKAEPLEVDKTVTKEGIRVERGQVWRNCDKRMNGRTKTVESVDAHNGIATLGPAPFSKVRIVRMYKHSSGWEFVPPA